MAKITTYANTNVHQLNNCVFDWSGFASDCKDLLSYGASARKLAEELGINHGVVSRLLRNAGKKEDHEKISAEPLNKIATYFELDPRDYWVIIGK